jgi:hypothetical protein
MGRTNYANLGDVRRYARCRICKKEFSGSRKDVDKQIEIHSRYKHDIINPNINHLQIERDVKTDQCIKSGSKEFDEYVASIKNKFKSQFF